MIVGIDVHKHGHAAALLDERGGEIATLIFANSPKDYQRLLDWLVDHDAAEAMVGVESPGSYGRCLVAALVAAGHETLQVPAWRAHRERHRQGPGKTDPGDATSIAQAVLRKRSELSPALEPEIVRTLGMLELQRRRFVRDRTQAIQRLRSDSTHLDPVSEARVIRCDRQRELERLKRLRLGQSPTERTAARCIRELARDIEDLNKRIKALDAKIVELLEEHGNLSPTCRERGPTSPRRSSPRPVTFDAPATPAPLRVSAAPLRAPAAQAKRQDGTASIEAATAS